MTHDPSDDWDRHVEACAQEGVSPYETAQEAGLFEELWSMEYRISGDKPKAKEFAREFLDRHAIALAEGLRARYWPAHATDGVEYAAGHLDPRCVGCGESKNNGQAHGPNQGYGGCI